MEIIQQGERGYAGHANMILNADYAWKRCLIDDKNGKIVNNVGVLRHEDHQRIMDTVIQVRRRSLNGIADVIAAGLTTSESISTQLVGTENINEFQPAKRDMNPTAFQNNVTDFELVYTPLPITHQSWRIPFRQMGFGYKRSAGLTESVRQVSESLEEMLFNGDDKIQVTVNGSTSVIRGYTTHPDRSTQVVGDWTTGANALAGALLMVGKIFTQGAVSQANSCVLYVANNLWTEMQNDYVAAAVAPTIKTVKERLEAISEIREVKPAEKLADGNVLLVEMSDRTIEMPMASDIVTIPHLRMNDLDDQVFTTYAVMTPVFKVDRNGRMGMVHGTPA